MGKPFIKVTSDFTKDFNNLIDGFRDLETLVGIPETNTDRKEDEPITNAALLFINENGSPINNIPAREPMAKGIRKAQDDIAEQYKKCAQTVLNKGPAAIDVYYNRAGIIASSSIKNVITTQEDILPPSEATMAAREAAGIKSTKALIVTGQMRNAITHVVRNKSWLK